MDLKCLRSGSSGNRSHSLCEVIPFRHRLPWRGSNTRHWKVSR